MLLKAMLFPMIRQPKKKNVQKEDNAPWEWERVDRYVE